MATVDVSVEVQKFNQSELGTQVSNVHAGLILVQDDASCIQAKTRIRALKDLKKNIEEWWEPIAKPAWKLARDISAKKKQFLDPVESELAAQSKETARYEAQAQSPAEVDGLQTRAGVAKVRVFDLRAVLVAALDDERVLNWISGAVTEAVQSALGEQAKSLEKELEGIVPGIEVYRETVYARGPEKKAADTVKINRIQVESSTIREIGYKDGILEVAFKSGGTWNYRNVPANVFTELATSDSIGKFFAENVKGKFEATRVAA